MSPLSKNRHIAKLSTNASMQVYCSYSGTRQVDPGYKRTKADERPFGAHMDIPQLVAKQMRIYRQDQPTVAAASFDRYAANSFQAYVQSALNFSIQRGAVLYGRIDEEDNTVYVDIMYEPPQEGKAERLTLDIDCEEVRPCSCAICNCASTCGRAV
jgi:nuclear protein localization family protein 4